MTKSSDPYWDELGVAWSAVDPDIGLITARLTARLRWQSRWITAMLVIGLPACAAGVLLGIGTIIMGFSGAWNFILRGIAILAMSLVLAFVLSPLRGGMASGPLAQMVDFVIGRTQKLRSLVTGGLYACAIAAIFGLAGTVLRTRIANPPRLSPFIDLALLGALALALYLSGNRLRVKLDKYQALRRALTVDPEVRGSALP